MSPKLNSAIAVIGIDIGKNSFHVVGLDRRGAIALRQKWSRGQVATRVANRFATFCLMTGSGPTSNRFNSALEEMRSVPR
jgi:hypothetical protein